MKLVRSLLVAGMGTIITVAPLKAADYYVQATEAGPVSGAPLGAVALRSDDSPNASNPPLVRPKQRAQASNASLDGNQPRAQRLRMAWNNESRVGKWVKPRKKNRNKRGQTETAAPEEENTTVGSNEGTANNEGTQNTGGSNESAENNEGTQNTGGSSEGTANNEGTQNTGGSNESAENNEGTQNTGGSNEGAANNEGEEIAGGSDEGTANDEGETNPGGSTDGAESNQGEDIADGSTETSPPPAQPSQPPAQPTQPPAQPTQPPAQSSQPPSQGETFKSFSSLLQSGKLKGGDRIYLMDGYHGMLSIRGAKFSSPVLITNVPGQVAHVDSIIINNSSNLAFSGLKVWARSPNAGPGPLIATYADTSDISFTNFDVRGVADSGNYMQWTKSQWLNNQHWGFNVDGNRVTIAKNRVTGIGHGIFTIADNALVEENIVDGYSGDAYRGLGDNTIVRRNKAQNCFQVDGNHMDGFQSFTVGANGAPGAGTQHNLTIEDNKFFEWTSSNSNPLRCKLQGIGLFDGMFDGLIIRNNVVTATGYHGITVSGGLNTQIVNNTVSHPEGVAGNQPWIKVDSHKNGTPSRDVVIANNLAMNILTQSDPAKNVTVTNNMFITNAFSEFTSVANQDFSLKPGAPAVDKALAKYAPKDDIAGTARPKGNGPDLGAYESR